EVGVGSELTAVDAALEDLPHRLPARRQVLAHVDLRELGVGREVGDEACRHAAVVRRAHELHLVTLDLDKVPTQRPRVGFGHREARGLDERGDDECRLGRPTPVDRRATHAGAAGDGLDRERAVALLLEELARRRQDRLVVTGVPGTPGPATAVGGLGRRGVASGHGGSSVRRTAENHYGLLRNLISWFTMFV